MLQVESKENTKFCQSNFHLVKPQKSSLSSGTPIYTKSRWTVALLSNFFSFLSYCLLTVNPIS